MARISFALLPFAPNADAANLAFFDSAKYVDTTSTGEQAEADNLRRSLGRLGHTTNRFTKIDAATLASVLAANHVLVIPELELKDLAPDLSTPARQSIADFVFAGGGMIISGTSNQRAADVLNAVFDWELTTGVVGDSDKTQQSVGTFFEPGPVLLHENVRTRGLNDGSLPLAARRVYTSGVVSTVVMFSHGLGRVVYLGWDWFDAKPQGSQDGGWDEALAAAVAETARCLDTSSGDADGDGLADLCEPLSPCVDVDGSRAATVNPRVILKKILADTTVGNDRLKIKAEFDLPSAIDFAAISPRRVPVSLIVRAGDRSELLATSLTGARYEGDGTAGWRLTTKGKWLYRDETGTASDGIVFLKLKDLSATAPGRVRVVLLGVNGDYPVLPGDEPLSATLLVGDAGAGACTEFVFDQAQCRVGRGGGSLRCID